MSINMETTAELSSLRREVQGLEALEYQMHRNVESMQQRRMAALYAGTLSGRMWGWINRLLALYCAFRVINVSPSRPAILFFNGISPSICYSVRHQSRISAVVPKCCFDSRSAHQSPCASFFVVFHRLGSRHRFCKSTV